MEQSDFPDIAKKIIRDHRARHETLAAQLRKNLQGPATVLSAVVTLMNERPKYFARTGEHFSVQDFEGIRVVDALDEDLLKRTEQVLKQARHSEKRKPVTHAVDLIGGKLTSLLRDMPSYPVGYVVLFILQKAFEQFARFVEKPEPFTVDGLERAFVHVLSGIVDKYVASRDRPVLRHFSEVAREYSVVARLKCSCGQEKFDVKLQSLRTAEGGRQYDCLDLQCKNCNACRSITFDLPHIKDMYAI